MSIRNLLAKPGIKPILFTLFMTSFGFGVILPIVPFYALSFGAKPFELGMLTATFALMSLVFSPILGKLGDHAGRKKILLIGTAGFAVSYVIFASASSLLMTFVARALEGIFAAAIFPTCISLVSDLTTEHERGKIMGMVGMSFSLGFILGPAFGGIASAISVRDAFLLSAGLASLNFLSVMFSVTEPQREKSESRDIPAQEKSLLGRLTSPLLFLFVSSFMITFMIGGLDAILALYTSEKLGFSSPQVGLIFTYIGALIMVMQFAVGNLVNRYGELRLIQAGFILSGAGFLLLSFTNSWISLLLPLAVFVAGNAMVFPSVSSLLTKKVTGKRGAVLGLDASFRSLGQFVGPLLGGFLYSIDHAYAFASFAVLIWVYFVMFTLIGRKKL